MKCVCKKNDTPVIGQILTRWFFLVLCPAALQSPCSSKLEKILSKSRKMRKLIMQVSFFFSLPDYTCVHFDMIRHQCASLNGPEWYFITILDNVTQVCVSAPLGWSFWKKNWSSARWQHQHTAAAAAWALQKSTINEKRLRQRDPNEATPPSLSLRLSSTSHTTCMLLLLGPAEILITIQRLLAIMTLLSTHTYIYTRTTPLLVTVTLTKGDGRLSRKFKCGL